MLTIRTLRTHLRRRAAEMLARPIVRREGALAAARAMRHLNAYAKDSAIWSSAIYQAKTELIRALYEDYPGPVLKHAQKRRCRGYFDRQLGRFRGCEGESCEKCQGTGIYGSLDLLLFSLEIDGEQFFWHLLADQVDWRVETTGSIDVRRAGSGFVYTTLTDWDAEFLYAILRVYLAERAGEQVIDRTRISIRDAIGTDVARFLLFVGHGGRTLGGE